MDEGVDPRRPACCPACGQPLGDEIECPACALPFGGAEATELRTLRASLASLDAQVQGLDERRRALRAQIQRRVAARPVRSAATPAGPPAWPDARRELDPAQVRNALLALGTALLALAALAFTAVAWARFGDGGRAALLAAVTIATVALAGVVRRRLPATAAALAALAIALGLIDWYALRRAGVGDGISAAAWWAWGCLVITVFAAALGRLTGARTARVAAAVLPAVGATLGVVTVCGAWWSLALGFALVAAGVTAAIGPVTERWDGLASWLRVEAVLVWAAGAIAASVAAGLPASFAAAVLPAGSVLALGIAPTLAARRGTATPHMVAGGLAAGVAAGTPIGAVITLCAPAFGPSGLLTLASLLAVLVIVAAGWAPDPWRRGCAGAGAITLAPAVGWAGVAVVVAASAPVAWLWSAWTGETAVEARAVFAGPETTRDFPVGGLSIVVLLTVSAAWVAAATTFGQRVRLVAPATGVVAALLGLAGAAVVAPVVTSATVGVAAAVTVGTACALLLTSAIVGRTHGRLAHRVAAVAALPALAAMGWSAVSEATTCWALAATLAVAVVATVVGRAEPLRTGHLAIAGASAIMLVALTVAANGSATAVVGFATGVAAVIVTVSGATWRRGSPRGTGLELIGVLGFAVAMPIASVDAVWLATMLTVAVPWLTVATLDRERRARYGIAATAAALGATWAWLAVAGVDVVEAYTLPAAAAALVIGELALARRASRSLLTIGPAITLALGPSLAFAIRDDDVLRAVLCGIAAFALVLIGARRRLQAPVVLGSAALITLGIDTLSASPLPRWAALAIPGVLMLWIGATFERRREAMRAAAQRFTEFA